MKFALILILFLAACSSSSVAGGSNPSTSPVSHPTAVSHLTPDALTGTWEVVSRPGQFMALYQDRFAFFNQPSDATVGPIWFTGNKMTFEASPAACPTEGNYTWSLSASNILTTVPLASDDCPRSEFMTPGTFKLYSHSVVPLG